MCRFYTDGMDEETGNGVYKPSCLPLPFLPTFGEALLFLFFASGRPKQCADGTHRYNNRPFFPFFFGGVFVVGKEKVLAEQLSVCLSID